jgi:hypothetical protein
VQFFREMDMRLFHAALAIAVPVSLATAPAVDGKGCIRGAVAGGVAGHFAGHHALAGAAAGCVAGHMYYKHKARQAHAAPRHR